GIFYLLLYAPSMVAIADKRLVEVDAMAFQRFPVALHPFGGDRKVGGIGEVGYLLEPAADERLRRIICAGPVVRGNGVGLESVDNAVEKHNREPLFVQFHDVRKI